MTTDKKTSTPKVEKTKVEPGVRQQAWLDATRPVEVIIGDQKMYLEPKCFSTGSVGYGLSGKIQLPRGEFVDRIQVSANLTVIGSKEW